MKKFLVVGAFGLALFMGISAHNSVEAKEVGTCASKCGAKPIQFAPGQYVRVEVVNHTPRTLQLQKINVANSVSIQPGRAIQFPQMRVTEPNASLIFWDDTGRALKAVVTKVNVATLRVELRPDWYPPGDRSIYLRDDGRVSVL